MSASTKLASPPTRTRRELRILVAFDVISRGGAEMTLMLLLEILSEFGKVTLLTAGVTDLNALNVWCGTRLDTSKIRVMKVPGIWLIPRGRGHQLRCALFHRYAARIGEMFDVRVSAHNIVAWKKPGIHFIGNVDFLLPTPKPSAEDGLPLHPVAR